MDTITIASSVSSVFVFKSVNIPGEKILIEGSAVVLWAVSLFSMRRGAQIAVLRRTADIREAVHEDSAVAILS